MPPIGSYSATTTYQTRTQSVTLQRILLTLQDAPPKHTPLSPSGFYPIGRINALPLRTRKASWFLKEGPAPLKKNNKPPRTAPAGRAPIGLFTIGAAYQ